MAHHKSALKAARHSETRHERNKSHRSSLKTSLKRFRELLDSEDVDGAKKILQSTLSLIDHKATLGIIHKNTASRYKSRLTKALNKSAKPAA